MYVVESKKVREALEFRKKSLRAIGMHSAADLLDLDIKEILSHEMYLQNLHPVPRESSRHPYTDMLRDIKS